MVNTNIKIELQYYMILISKLLEENAPNPQKRLQFSRGEVGLCAAYSRIARTLDNLSRLQICTSGPQLVRLKLPLKQSQNMAHITRAELVSYPVPYHFQGSKHDFING